MGRADKYTNAFLKCKKKIKKVYLQIIIVLIVGRGNACILCDV